ncbi:EpsG family protein [Gottfriedia sp. NPDC058432]|uniref:EpsG family protein n=1 Tax=Gottfriedia sp. NPDC058432 TaxID=3346497 RepID=UPI00364F5898
MVPYVLTLLFAYSYGWLAKRFGIIKNKQFINNKYFIFPVLITLILISGLRFMNALYSDEWIYRSDYAKIGNMDFKDIFSLKIEPGFALLNWALYKISIQPQFLIFICAAITNTLIVLTIAKFSEKFELSILLYICIGFYFTSFNIMRQYLAISIVFWAIRYLGKGKFIKYLISILVASTFHFSALIMIPTYLIYKGRAWTKWTILTMVSGVTFTVSFAILVNILEAALANTKYSDYLKTLTEGYYGVNILRILIFIIPLFPLFIWRVPLKKIYSNSDHLVNLYVIGVIFMLLSSNYVFIARIADYFTIFSVLLIPKLTALFKKSSFNQLIYFGIMVCYMTFFYYQISNSAGYTSIFSI